jgi:hypothetical protein
VSRADPSAAAFQKREASLSEDTLGEETLPVKARAELPAPSPMLPRGKTVLAPQSTSHSGVRDRKIRETGMLLEKYGDYCDCLLENRGAHSDCASCSWSQIVLCCWCQVVCEITIGNIHRKLQYQSSDQSGNLAGSSSNMTADVGRIMDVKGRRTCQLANVGST